MTIHPTYDRESKARFSQLVFLFAVMLIMAAVFSFLITPVLSMISLSETESLLVSQICSSLLVFWVPPLLLNTYYKARHLRPFFHPLARVSGLQVVLGLSVALLALVPSSLLEDLMRRIPEPWVFTPFSAQVERITEMMISDHSAVGIALALIALVVVAPLAEEYLFRGVLQQWVLSVTRSGHVAVWVVALLFSLIHMEWGGLLSRAFMGVLLGYAALYGGLRVSVPMHALNNLLVYLLLLSGNSEPWSPPAGGVVYVLISLVCLIAIVIILKYMSQRTKSEYHETID